MHYTDQIFIECELIDDGTLDFVVGVKNSISDRVSEYRYDRESFGYPEVLEQAKEDFLEDFYMFIQHHSNF